MVRLISPVIGFGLVLVVIAGCDPAQGIADRIRAANSSLVKDVEYHRADISSVSEVRVHLVPEATVAQAHQFWCNIVAPASARDLGGEPYVIVLSSDPAKAGVDGLVLADEHVRCPPS